MDIYSFLDKDQRTKLKKWRMEQNILAAEIQAAEVAKRKAKPGYVEGPFDQMLSNGPYYGVASSEYSVTITPSSVGDSIVFTHSITGNKLDLTGNL